ncbi:MAG: glucose-6-phosphate isomerase [Nitrospirae bacterium]|nr:glucose-6-phosphate isomerase [Nitrospirota bacterium]MBF0535810.1 glucose-6-phosphate isomerase [Nitrospirota bacterium]MBF0617725.1 glucose-6-phosphate isomerase [Nitrospirota bacterium]
MLEVYFGNMLEEVIGEKGLSLNQIEGIREKVLSAHKQIEERKWKELSFLDLGGQTTTEIKKIARHVRETSEHFVILGIGGSAIGPRAILESLSPLHNYRGKPKIHIFDNIDPRTIATMLEIIDPAKTTVNVVTKSGNTAETIATFMLLWDKIEKAVGSEVVNRFILTTNPEKGIIRSLINEYNIKSLEIPTTIVGRYSVLTTGLLLAEVAGISSDELLRGAHEITEKCKSGELWENPAYIFSSLLYLMSTEEGRNINVIMPYADGLKAFSDWFCQLWAESLGKLGFGITPYPSVGTTDQHSQLQLWMEGPEDKVVIFIKIKDYGKDIMIPMVFSDKEGFNCLAGRSLNELISTALQSTEHSLSDASKPNVSIAIPILDAYHVGQLFQFFEIATAFLGFLFGVNPFNQPWVETGKNNLYGALGKPGFQTRNEQIEKMQKDSVCWKI